MHNHDNRSVKQWLVERNNEDDLPRWVDDVLTGAGRLNESERSNTNPLSPKLLLIQLMTHDYLNTKVISESLNRKRVALGDEPVSSRWATQVCSACISASKSVAYHIAKGTPEEGVWAPFSFTDASSDTSPDSRFPSEAPLDFPEIHGDYAIGSKGRIPLDEMMWSKEQCGLIGITYDPRKDFSPVPTGAIRYI